MKTPLTDQWLRAFKNAWKIWLVIFTVGSAALVLEIFMPHLGKSTAFNGLLLVITLALIYRFVSASKSQK